MKENQEYQIGLEVKCQLAGWILFIICAIFLRRIKPEKSRYFDIHS